ncbi:MAG: ABC transporter permease [Candidatus Heimdallarchaeota archaeon]|nr:MAG: hypothetical protein DRO63_04745 [Candidatus Gerdarchaeota archaeon]RLI69035.1 MAG: hypothetical protein DRO91_08220 [Candidatus Heimdallarchaeota archaeon]
MSKRRFFKNIYLSLRRIWAETSRIGLGWVRSPAAVFFTFIYPIIMILLFGYLFAGEGTTTLYSLPYLNEDTYQVGNATLPYYPAQELLTELGLNNDSLGEALGIKLIPVNFNTSEILPQNWMKEQNAAYLLRIPKGWSAMVNASLLNASAPKALVQYYYDPGYTSSTEVMKIIDNALKELNAQLFNIETSIGIITTTTPEREELSYIDFYIPGIIMVTLSTSGMMGLVSTVAEGRRNGIIFKMSATPMKKWEWALAQEIWQIIISLVIALLTALTGVIAFGFQLSAIHPLHVVILIFGSMTFAGLALIIARFVKSPEGAVAATLAFVFPQMFLSGSIIPPEVMPEFLQQIARIFPLYYIAKAMRAAMLEATLPKVWLPLGITIAMGVIFFILGSALTIWKKD